MELFHDPKWHPLEFAQAMLWYHLRAVRDTSGHKTADIPTILKYYELAPKKPPTLAEIENYFSDPRNGVEAIGDRYFVPPPNARWFEQQYGEKVFGCDFPDFAVTSDQPSAPPIPVGTSVGAVRARSGFWQKVLNFGKNPWAWWIGIVLAILKFFK